MKLADGPEVDLSLGRRRCQQVSTRNAGRCDGKPFQRLSLMRGERVDESSAFACLDIGVALLGGRGSDRPLAEDVDVDLTRPTGWGISLGDSLFVDVVKDC